MSDNNSTNTPAIAIDHRSLMLGLGQPMKLKSLSVERVDIGKSFYRSGNAGQIDMHHTSDVMVTMVLEYSAGYEVDLDAVFSYKSHAAVKGDYTTEDAIADLQNEKRNFCFSMVHHLLREFISENFTIYTDNETILAGAQNAKVGSFDNREFEGKSTTQITFDDVKAYTASITLMNLLNGIVIDDKDSCKFNEALYKEINAKARAGAVDFINEQQQQAAESA